MGSQQRDLSGVIRVRRILPALAIALALLTACGRSHGLTEEDVAWLQTAEEENPWEAHLEDMPEPTIGMRVRNIGPLGKLFNDSNHVHLAEAQSYGIEPLTDTRSHYRLKRPLVKIRSCREYYVEPMKYARPYLVPEAAEMLREIGERFRDSMAVRGGGNYRIKVTSVLRTPESVKRLKRRNSNATDSSVHRFGTTIDISYSRFIADDDSLPRSCEDMKNLLGEVLYAMRQEGKCYVKMERKQPCFHITARRAAYTK